MLTLGILASGELGFDILKQVTKEYQVEFVLTDSNSQSIIKFCEEKGLPFYKGNPRNERAYRFIKKIRVEVIMSVNYLFIIGSDIINHSSLLTFNIHGSLLPKYRGRTPHVWAIINGESETGITAHVIDENCDTGEIIKQLVVPISSEDTGAYILEKYKLLYYPLIKEVLSSLDDNTIKFKPQNEIEATFFGKRTPDDGQIDWGWSSKRIKDWVRAQSDPYPGAFTFFKDEKFIIDKVSILDEPNESRLAGTILELVPVIKVSTSDGVVSLDRIRNNDTKLIVLKKFE